LFGLIPLAIRVATVFKVSSSGVPFLFTVSKSELGSSAIPPSILSGTSNPIYFYVIE
jgi:hypothetical protein